MQRRHAGTVRRNPRAKDRLTPSEHAQGDPVAPLGAGEELRLMRWGAQRVPGEVLLQLVPSSGSSRQKPGTCGWGPDHLGPLTFLSMLPPYVTAVEVEGWRLVRT
jgi:hypothetical protein